MNGTAMVATTLELIYVRRNGPVDAPNNTMASGAVAEPFSKMVLNDRTLVALIGGRHAFGGAHINTSG